MCLGSFWFPRGETTYDSTITLSYNSSCPNNTQIYWPISAKPYRRDETLPGNEFIERTGALTALQSPHRTPEECSKWDKNDIQRYSLYFWLFPWILNVNCFVYSFYLLKKGVNSLPDLILSIESASRLQNHVLWGCYTRTSHERKWIYLNCFWEARLQTQNIVSEITNTGLKTSSWCKMHGKCYWFSVGAMATLHPTHPHAGRRGTGPLSSVFSQDSDRGTDRK